MLVFLIILLDVLMLFFTFSSFSDKKRIFVSLAEAISVFLCLYSIISALGWVLELFTIGFSLILGTVLVTVVFAIVYFKSQKKGLEFFSLGERKFDIRVIIARGVIIISTLLSLGAYSTAGIGRNDGNAQLQALSILNGNNSLKFEIDEYENIIPDSNYEQYFFDSIRDIDKENFTAQYEIKKIKTEEGKTEEDKTEEVKTERMVGEFGNNPIYPSILALSGSLFGFERMAYIQAIFAFCLFVFVDEILRALKCDWKLRALLVLLLGVSPIMIFSNHTTLVEPLIGFCMVMFLYYLVCKNDMLQMLSALGAITFAFIHTSVYTMIPLFLILYWMYFIHSKKIRHLVSSGIVIVGYILSFLFVNFTAYENTAINYRLGIPFLGDYYYLFVIIISAIAVIFGLIIGIIVKKTNSNESDENKNIKAKIVFKILMAVGAFASIPATIVITILNCKSFPYFLNITFIEIMVCSGVVLLPYILFRLVSTTYYVGIKEAVTVVAFLYTTVLYSFVMKPMLDGYYYNSRYISYFIPFVIIIAGMMLRLIKREGKYFLPVIGILILLLPYSLILFDGKAETRFNNQILEDVTSYVEENADEDTVVFVERSLLKYFYYPLKNIDKVNIYPIESGYFETFYYGTDIYRSKVIYITDDNGDGCVSKGTLKYLNYNIPRLPSGTDVSYILGLPNEYHDRTERKIQIVEYDAFYRLLSENTFKRLELKDLDLTINHIDVTDEGIAHIIVSLTDGSEIYRNDKLLLSYHLEYNNAEDRYECPRLLFDSLTADEYLIEVDLSEQPEDVTVVIDVVEDGVAWYSYDNKVPVIVFTETDEEWDYKTYYFYTKLK